MKLESRETLYDYDNVEDERSFWDGRGWPISRGYVGYVSFMEGIQIIYCISGSISEFASPKVVNYIDRCPVSLPL